MSLFVFKEKFRTLVYPECGLASSSCPSTLSAKTNKTESAVQTRQGSEIKKTGASQRTSVKARPVSWTFSSRSKYFI